MKNKEHLYGIDLLRLLSFAYVIVLHTIGHGGIIANCPAGSHQYMLAAGLEIWAYCAVTLFGLISGYVGYRPQREKSRKKRARAYLSLWLQVVFYAVGLSLIQYFLMPGSLTRRDLIPGFFPVTSGQYWYFTAYTGLFVLMPVLNAALLHLDGAFLKRFLLIWLIVFALYASPMERFSLQGGYSTLWLVILYLAGGAVRKLQSEYDASEKKSFTARLERLAFSRDPLTAKDRLMYLGGIFLCALFAWVWLMRGWHFTLFGTEVKRTTWMNYTSFTVSLAALLHLLWFSRIRVSKKLRRPLAAAASCSFGIYLLNTQPALWKLTDGRFAFLGSARLIHLLLAILLNVLVFMTAGIIMDYARQALFGIFSSPAPPSAPSASSR